VRFRFWAWTVWLLCAAASSWYGGSQVDSKAHLPYTARFKITTVRHLADGSDTTTQSEMVDSVDSQGRHFTAYTEGLESAAERKPTRVQVSDPVNLFMSYWEVPGTKGTLVHMPDLGEPETECAKKLKAINPLHPAGVVTPPESLGTQTFLGVDAKGGRISFTPTIVRLDSGPAQMRTNEAWLAVDPRLGNLLVRMVSTTPQDVTTREMIEFRQAEPDPNLFVIPADRQITRREGQAYICDIRPRPSPVPSQAQK